MRLSALVFLSVMPMAQAFNIPGDWAVKSYQCTICTSLSREPLSLAWLTQNKVLGHETMRKQTSRKYQVKANLQELQKGVALYSDAPGAIIRISPANSEQKLQPEFRIRNAATKKTFSLRDASSQFTQELSAQDNPLTESTLAFAELKPEINSGKLILSSSTKTSVHAAKQSHYVVQVNDKNSLTLLSIETDKAAYQYGDQLTGTIQLKNEDKNYVLQNISVTMKDSSGNKTSLPVTNLGKNAYQVKASLNSEKNDKGQNWYIEVFASGISGDHMVYRQAHTSFSYRIPSAAIREVEMTKADSLEFKAKIEVATDSRYALQAVLYGTDDKGQTQAIQTVQSAAWLTRGENTLDFSFDKNLNSGFQAPYFLGYLHLTDYGQNRPVFEYDTPIELSNLG